jgi:hypothetical protein
MRDLTRSNVSPSAAGPAGCLGSSASVQLELGQVHQKNDSFTRGVPPIFTVIDNPLRFGLGMHGDG